MTSSASLRQRKPWAGWETLAEAAISALVLCLEKMGDNAVRR